MANTQKKIKTIISPKGVAQYPYLQRPDTQHVKEGLYKTKLVIADGYEKFQQLLDEKLAESVEEGRSKDKDVEAVEPYEINEDGALVLNFKQKAEIKNKAGEVFKQKPTIADGKGKSITKDIKIGSGTVLKVAFQPVPYFAPSQKKGKTVIPAVAGVTLRLKGVQILELVQFGGTMFGADEEASYEYEEGDDEVTNEETNGNEASDDSEDF